MGEGEIVAVVLGGLVVLGLMIVLIVNIAKEFASIAEKKGHNGKRYFWWTFWLGVVGMLMVIALPDVSGSGSNARGGGYRIASEELPEL